MSTIIIIAALLAVIHFIYESILLPVIRLHLRNRLFVLRDEIRDVMIQENIQGKDEAFMFVHDGICKFLNRLPEITLDVKAGVENEIKENPSLYKDTMERINKIKSHENKRLVLIFNETNMVLQKAFIANAGAWLVYLVPIVLLMLSIRKIADLAAELIAMPTVATERLIPIHK